MLATMSQQMPDMSASLYQASPKRPRLSLQIKSAPLPTTLGKSATALKADIDMSSPTAFNTLSNAYAAAIENASPRTAATPRLDFKTPSSSTKPTSLRLVTNASSQDSIIFPSQRTQTPGPFSIVYPDTPTSSSSYSNATPTSAYPNLRALNTPTFTYTPPTSAHPSDGPVNKTFLFPATPSSPRTPRRRATLGSHSLKAPYTHPQSLHSILRNSPLPAPSKITTCVSPSRASARIAEKSAKKVCYNNPLTQTITNNKYIKSHIDLLAEDASPYSPMEKDTVLSTIVGPYTGDETRDGGQTPGPFEEMRRRMADTEVDTPTTKKRKREKKRNWVWTIGQNEEEEGSVKADTPISAIKHSDSGVLLTPTIYKAPTRRDVGKLVLVVPQAPEAPEAPTIQDEEMDMLTPTGFVSVLQDKTDDDIMDIAPIKIETLTPTIYAPPQEWPQIWPQARVRIERPGSSHSI